MAELIKQILSLPRSEKWQVFTLLAEALREEEGFEWDIPDWQLEMAQEAERSVGNGEVKTNSKEIFWKEIDELVDSLKNS